MFIDLSSTFANTDAVGGTSADTLIESMQIRLLGSGVFRTDAAQVHNFLLPTFLMVCYRQGSVTLHRGEETTVLEPGTFYLFLPYEIYSGTRTGSAPVEFSFLQFDISPYLERIDFCASAAAAGSGVFCGETYRHLGALLNAAAGEAPGTAGRAALLRQLTQLTAAQIVHDGSALSGELPALHAGREALLVERAFRYTAAHMAEPIVIRSIVQDTDSSKTSLDRAFRTVLNTTPHQALLRFKLERSMEMLQQQMPLRTIAAALGFSSVYHFSNAFLSVIGMRPTQYRQSGSLAGAWHGEPQ